MQMHLSPLRTTAKCQMNDRKPLRDDEVLGASADGAEFWCRLV